MQYRRPSGTVGGIEAEVVSEHGDEASRVRRLHCHRAIAEGNLLIGLIDGMAVEEGGVAAQFINGQVSALDDPPFVVRLFTVPVPLLIQVELWR